MSPDGGPGPEERLARDVAGLVRGPGGDASDDRSPVQAARSFAALEARRTRATASARTRRLVFAVAACALVAGAGGFWTRARLEPQPLTYAMNGGPARGVGSIPAAPGGPATKPSVLSFSDGTRIQMAAEARGRVVELDKHGGRIALEDGRAQVQVVHRERAKWFFEAGPFTIQVHGTAFSFGWDARTSRFDLRMESGLVSVTGPVSGGEIFLRAGETLSVGLGDREAVEPARSATADRPASPGEVPPAPALRTSPAPARRTSTPVRGAPPPASRALAVVEPAPAPAGTAGDAPRAGVRTRPFANWVSLLADGQAAEIVADAERLGVDRALADCSSEELAALADAARFQRNDRLARRALLAQRQRFPRSLRAAEASFLLGRLDDESGADGRERALTWYDRYLLESRGGAYVSEAMGRKMMVLERSGRRTDAAAIAADYLRRFPSGTYAHAAQALVHAP
jgi:hypothetical protein